MLLWETPVQIKERELFLPKKNYKKRSNRNEIHDTTTTKLNLKVG